MLSDARKHPWQTRSHPNSPLTPFFPAEGVYGAARPLLAGVNLGKIHKIHRRRNLCKDRFGINRTGYHDGPLTSLIPVMRSVLKAGGRNLPARRAASAIASRYTAPRVHSFGESDRRL